VLQVVGNAEDALAMALAKITGFVELKPRSLLTAHEDFTTLQFISPYVVDKPGQVRRLACSACWLHCVTEGRVGSCCSACKCSKLCLLLNLLLSMLPASSTTHTHSLARSSICPSLSCLPACLPAGVWLPAQAHPRRGHPQRVQAHDADC
jgi:hypothetical protein